MDILIKYRNDRKKEGASKAELNGLDGRINAFLSTSNTEEQLDLELLVYRRHLVEANADKEFIERVDKKIFHLLGSKPAHLIELIAVDITGVDKGITVCVDKANESIGDLESKAATALGISSDCKFKLIFGGKHHSDPKAPLSNINLISGDKIVICRTLSCKGSCEAREYSNLCYARLRAFKETFAGMSDEKIDKLFKLFSKIHAPEPKVTWPDSNLPWCVALGETELGGVKSISSLLSAKKDAKWVLPESLVSASLASAPETKVLESPTNSDEALLAAAATPLPLNDEDLYA